MPTRFYRRPARPGVPPRRDYLVPRPEATAPLAALLTEIDSMKRAHAVRERRQALQIVPKNPRESRGA
jgi:hypothetical protein